MKKLHRLTCIFIVHICIMQVFSLNEVHKTKGFECLNLKEFKPTQALLLIFRTYTNCIILRCRRGYTVSWKNEIKNTYDSPKFESRLI